VKLTPEGILVSRVYRNPTAKKCRGRLACSARTRLRASAARRPDYGGTESGVNGSRCETVNGETHMSLMPAHQISRSLVERPRRVGDDGREAWTTRKRGCPPSRLHATAGQSSQCLWVGGCPSTHSVRSGHSP